MNEDNAKYDPFFGILHDEFVPFHCRKHLAVNNDIAAVLRIFDFIAVRPNIAKEYEKLKFSLAEKFRFDRDAYTDGKTDFVQKYTAEAIEYFSRNSKKPPRS